MNTKILSSILVMGVAIALTAGAGAVAVFSDTEASRGNTFTAGQLDLQIDFDGYYNKEVDGEPNAGSWSLTDLSSEVFFDFDDIKPGDWGEGTISLHVYDNPAHIWMGIDNVQDNENGWTEPELSDALAGIGEEDTTGGEFGVGELSSWIMVELWWDDGNNILDDGEEVAFDGVLADLADGWYLGELDNCENYYIGMSWWVPIEVGNWIQSDMVTFDMMFYAEQLRHNEAPAGPEWWMEA